MKYCTKCGTQLPDNAAYCSNCGAPCDNEDEIKFVNKNDFNNNYNYNYSNDNEYHGGSNGAAVAGFICSFIIPLLGFILSLIGLSNSKKLNGNGRSLAIAGIIISIISFFINFLVVLSGFSYLSIS